MNKFVMFARSKYMRIRMSSPYYSSNKGYSQFEATGSILNLMLVYFQYGHLIIP